ncbi:DUF397 domain-containing protein [Spirillospora sp. NPDC127200]
MEMTGWRKSTYSTAQNDQCVEVASTFGFVAVRDSKDPAGPKLFVTRAQARALSIAIKKL